MVAIAATGRPDRRAQARSHTSDHHLDNADDTGIGHQSSFGADLLNKRGADRWVRGIATRPYSYAGPDRRKPVTTTDLRAQVWRIVAGVAIAMVLWSVNVAVGTRTPISKSLVISLSHGITGALFLASAALALAVWRIAGTTRAACAVVGLSLAGVCAPVMGVLSRAAKSGNVRVDLVEMLSGTMELVFIACVTGALLLPPVVARLRPLRITTPVVAACILAVAAILSVDASGETSGLLSTVGFALRIANLALWIIAATAFIVFGRRRNRIGDIWLGVALLFYAVGAAGRVAISSVDYRSGLVSTGFALAAACVVAGVATIALWRLHTGSGTRLLQVADQLRGTQTDLATLESDQARRLHDARNTIFAIAGATDLLAHGAIESRGHDNHSNRAADYTNRINPADLQRLITVELNHLGHLLDPKFSQPADIYTAAMVLEPLVLAYRAHGVAIDADIDDCPIYGRSETVANAVTNILTNARMHAPGAHIWITATSADNHVVITIADDGPGIPEAEQAAVLLPGIRGSATVASETEGSGLGLASAAQALSEVGGTLRISERKGGGGMITFTIPTHQTASSNNAPAVALSIAATDAAAGVESTDPSNHHVPRSWFRRSPRRSTMSTEPEARLPALR